MEIKKKEWTLSGQFSKYIAVFCLITVLLLGLSFFIFGIMTVCGLVLPANAAERQLNEKESEIRKTKEVSEKLLPFGCSYGVYDSDGNWLYGNLAPNEREGAWQRFMREDKYAETTGFYRFISRKNGEICIVKYYLAARYSIDNWNRFLPPPESLVLFIFAILFLVNGFIMSRIYGKNMQKRLLALNEVTEKIANNDLDFTVLKTDIREINDVMTSLEHMKTALKDSLEKQWSMEEQKKIQLAALTHDIKTPLTIIRGNAELMAENDLSEENKECVDYIIQNALAIEQYQQAIRDVLQGRNTLHENDNVEEIRSIPCAELGEKFKNAAEQLAVVQQMPLSIDISTADTIQECLCREEQLLRAWNNIVSNAMEHTDKQKGIHISMKLCRNESGSFFAACVRDFGEGFSKNDLKFADQAFYSGDASRHDRRHQGMGLAIAKQFLEMQGGYLEFKNTEDGKGAEVTMYISI